jgi:hypothetical protein
VQGLAANSLEHVALCEYKGAIGHAALLVIKHLSRHVPVRAQPAAQALLWQQASSLALDPHLLAINGPGDNDRPLSHLFRFCFSMMCSALTRSSKLDVRPLLPCG